MTEVRIPSLPKDQWTDAAREVFAFWGEPNSWEEGSKTTVISVMGNHPALGMAYNMWGKQLLMGNTLGTRNLELVVLRTAWNLRNAYEWHHHVGFALNAGMTLEEIGAVRTFPESGTWSANDAAILSSVDELKRDGIISAATWETLSLTLDTKQLMDLVFTIGHYTMTSWAIETFGIPVESWADVIGFDLKTASGLTPARKFKPGEGEGWADGRDG